MPSVGFTLKKEEGVAFVGGEGVGGGTDLGGDCEGIDPLHEGAILSAAGEALGERDTRFAVIGMPCEEGAQSLFGIVPLVTCHQDFGDVEAQYFIACRIGIVGEGGFERTLGGGECVLAECGEGFADFTTIGRGVSRCCSRLCVTDSLHGITGCRCWSGEMVSTEPTTCSKEQREQ